jgi:hypothetical protein
MYNEFSYVKLLNEQRNILRVLANFHRLCFKNNTNIYSNIISMVQLPGPLLISKIITLSKAKFSSLLNRRKGRRSLKGDYF